MSEFVEILERAIQFRDRFLSPPHDQAFRLLNGHLEGLPGLVIDVYGSTLVCNSTARDRGSSRARLDDLLPLIRSRLPWLRCALLKQHFSPRLVERQGEILFGQDPDKKVREGNVWYALDLRMHQDASLYLDTRNLRQWAALSLKGKSVLNCFAYTGSLGVAALAGGAGQVLQTDLRPEYLQLARRSCALNSIPVRNQDFLVGDFWDVIARLKRNGMRFDCLFLDPPFFSSTPRGRLDLNVDSARLINKVRPLINNDGALVAVNNAVFLSGSSYMKELEALCKDGYLQIAELVPVPEDCLGPAIRGSSSPAVDPAPFNHSTKIAILKVSRKE